MKSVLITGANRGLGYELTKVFAQNGWKVYAVCRTEPDFSEFDADERIGYIPLDVSDQDSVDKLPDFFDSLDVLINNAGVADRDLMGNVTEMVGFDVISNVFKVNTIAPRLIADILTPALKKGDTRRVVTVSSVMSSISNASDFSLQRWVYSSSKTAVNFAMLGYASENPGIRSALVHPGWLKTDMGGPDAPEEPQEAAQKIYQLVQSDKLIVDKLIDTDGKVIPF